jgi:virulence factor Mce-like protein
MQKQAPTFGRLLTMVLFALSCFGLLLFLWLSFGGTVPLKPKGYRFEVAFPEATQLGLYADVRTAGVTVGKVRQKEIDPKGNRTLVTIQLDRRFAPLHSDARAILRQKTLLGETYVELTPGTRGAKPIPEGGRLGDGRVAKTVELDEIFQALDPKTRQAYRDWQRELATGIKGRPQDLNDALGTLPEFSASATDVLNVLNSQSGAVRRLFRNTGVVFNALSQNQQALHDLIVNSDRVFAATASQQRSLAETFSIFPTFLDESKATLARLQTFSANTDPLIQQLRPVAHDLKPTLRDVRAFAPDLRSFFVHLDPLITVSKTGLPALRDTLNGTTPLLAQLGPFLEQLNPILQWLEYNQHLTSDFISNGAGGLGDTTPLPPDAIARGEIGHYLRQNNPSGAESLMVMNQRPPGARGNAYVPPLGLQGRNHSKYNIFPSWDCKNAPKGAGYEATDTESPTEAQQNGPSCWTQALPLTSGPGQLPHIAPADYSKPSK